MFAHPAPVLSLASAGRRRGAFLSLAEDGVRVWETNGCCLFHAAQEEGTPRVVCMASSGSAVYVGCDDGSLEAWDLEELILHGVAGVRSRGQAPGPQGPVLAMHILPPDEA